MSHDDFLELAQSFHALSRKQLLHLAFTIHDLNNDGLIDTNDAFDLMTIHKVALSSNSYLIQQDVLSISEELNKKDNSASVEATSI